MTEKINLEEHIAKGIEKIVTDTLRVTMKDLRESAFMAKFAAVPQAARRGFPRRRSRRQLRAV